MPIFRNAFSVGSHIFNYFIIRQHNDRITLFIPSYSSRSTGTATNLFQREAIFSIHPISKHGFSEDPVEGLRTGASHSLVTAYRNYSQPTWVRKAQICVFTTFVFLNTMSPRFRLQNRRGSSGQLEGRAKVGERSGGPQKFFSGQTASFSFLSCFTV